MKKPKEQNIFDSVFALKRGTGEKACFYYRKNNRISIAHIINSLPNVENHELLFCCFMNEAEMLQGSCLHSSMPAFCSIEFAEEGEFYLHNQSGTILIEAGDAYVMQSDETIDIMTGPSGFCRKISFAVVGSALDLFLKFYGFDRNKIVTGLNLLEMKRIQQDFLNLSDVSGIERQAANARIVFRLFQQLHYGSIHSKVPEQLENIILDFERSPQHQFTLAELATRSHCSVMQLNRLFHKHFGCSIYQKLIEIRMNSAAALLRHTERNIKEIAGLCGYANSMGFSAAFRKHFGVSPKIFRKNNFS